MRARLSHMGTAPVSTTGPQFWEDYHARFLRCACCVNSVCRCGLCRQPHRKPVRQYRRDHLGDGRRSEEHTSELQSLMRISYAVFCLKKKKNITNSKIY